MIKEILDDFSFGRPAILNVSCRIMRWCSFNTKYKLGGEETISQP